jgi:hypothetical protein
VGARPTPGWIRAITQLGRSPGSCSQGIGCKRLLLITIVGYTATTALTAVSPGLIWLTVARFGAQGFLGAEWAVAITIVVEEFPREHRGQALGIVTSMNTLGGIFVGVLASVGLQDLGPGWRSFFLVGLIRRNEERAGAMAGPSYEARSVARARGVGDQLPSPRGMGYVLALYPSHRAKRARCTRDLEKVRLVTARALPATLALPAGAVAAI